jgi:hypothetical protein
MQRYTHQAHAFSGEITYTLYEDHLTIDSTKADSYRIAYSQINSIAIEYDPTRVELNRYLTTVTHSKGKLKITNSSYISFGEFDEHNKTYREFIMALHQQSFKSNPNINYHKGTTQLNYIFSYFIAFFIVMVLLFAIFYSLTHSFMGMVAVKVIVLLFSFPYLIEYIKKNRPQSYDPLDIPQEALPQKD